MGKNRLRILTGLLTGHCRLRGHLYKLGIVSSGVCRYYKSPGLDGISPVFLQQGQGKLLSILRKVMISSLALGHIPSAWSRARVVFIPKTGKKDITNPKSFRLISLMAFLLKTAGGSQNKKHTA